MSMASPYSPFFISGLHSRHSSLPESVASASFLDAFLDDDQRTPYPRHSLASSDFLSLDLAAPPPELADRYSKATKRSSGLLPSLSNNANIDRTRPPKNPPTAPLPASPTLTSSKPMSPPVPTLTLVASHTTTPEDILHLVPGEAEDTMSLASPRTSMSKDKRESTATRKTSSSGRTVSTHYRTTKRDDALAALEGLRRMRSNDTLRFAKFKARAVAKAQRERVARGVNWISMSDDEDDEASFWRSSASSTSKLVSSWRMSSSSRTASPAADTRRRRGTCALDFDFDIDHTLGFEALCGEVDSATPEEVLTPTPHAFARCQSAVPPRDDDNASVGSLTSESDELDGFVVVTSPYFDQRASASDTGLVLARSSNHLSPSHAYAPPSPAFSAPTHRPNRSTPSFLRPPSLAIPGRKKALSISSGSKSPTTPTQKKPGKSRASHHAKSSSDKADKSAGRKLKSFIDLRPAPRVAMGRSFVEVW
ncbi:hypothetical protein HDZ31DRAFT_41440 [Schizophyllum fasciatum]